MDYGPENGTDFFFQRAVSPRTSIGPHFLGNQNFLGTISGAISFSIKKCPNYLVSDDDVGGRALWGRFYSWSQTLFDLFNFIIHASSEQARGHTQPCFFSSVLIFIIGCMLIFICIFTFMFISICIEPISLTYRESCKTNV